MSILSKEASDTLARIEGDETMPQVIKDAIIAAYQSPSAKQNLLRVQTAIVFNDALPDVARIQAVERIVDVSKHGDI